MSESDGRPWYIREAELILQTELTRKITGQQPNLENSYLQVVWADTLVELMESSAYRDSRGASVRRFFNDSIRAHRIPNPLDLTTLDDSVVQSIWHSVCSNVTGYLEMTETIRDVRQYLS